MRLSDFKIGDEFRFDYPGSHVFRCTDIGLRVIVAIKVDPVVVAVKKENLELFHKTLTKAEAERDGWFIGPPYPVAEMVMDEDDMMLCVPMEKPQS